MQITLVSCLLALLSVSNLTLEEMCHVVTPFKNRALLGHVLETKEDLSFEVCTYQCEVEDKCFSVNFRTKSRKCELNFASKEMFPKDLVEEKNSLYIHNIRKERTDACQELSCRNGGSCYPLPRPRCLCPVAFQGPTCESTYLVLTRLGMESGLIQDGWITSSSASVGYEGWRARLHGEKCWKPSHPDPNPYIRVKFPSAVNITHIATQGAPAEDCWVTSFTIEYMDGSLIKKYPKTVSGNSDRGSVVFHLLVRPLRFTTLSIYPSNSQTCIALRFELYK